MNEQPTTADLMAHGVPDSTLAAGATPTGDESTELSSRHASTASGAITAEQRSYDGAIRKRVRIANVAALARAGGIQIVWLVVLIAGAAIPLSEAVITDGWTWLSPVLGFVVVAAAGLERIFSRTTNSAVSLDRLRRDLARERRLLMAEGGGAEQFAGYVARAEEAFARYDRDMVEYHSQIVRQVG